MNQTAIHILELVNGLPPASPHHEVIFLNKPMRTYLLSDSWPYQNVINDGPYKSYAQKVDYELRLAIAARRPTWYWLNRALWEFLAFNQAAARDYIPWVMDTIQRTILKNEWYELMPFYQLVYQHTNKTISIQHFPGQNR